jgi:hypothetical protein
MSNAVKTWKPQTYYNVYSVIKAVIITLSFSISTFGLLAYHYAIGSEAYFSQELEFVKAENALTVQELKEKHASEMQSLTEDRDFIKAKLDSALIPESNIATAANNHVVKPAKEKAIVAYEYTKEVSGKAYDYTKDKSEQVYDKVVSVFKQYN